MRIRGNVTRRARDPPPSRSARTRFDFVAAAPALAVLSSAADSRIAHLCACQRRRIQGARCPSQVVRTARVPRARPCWRTPCTCECICAAANMRRSMSAGGASPCPRSRGRWVHVRVPLPCAHGCASSALHSWHALYSVCRRAVRVFRGFAFVRELGPRCCCTYSLKPHSLSSYPLLSLSRVRLAPHVPTFFSCVSLHVFC
ncbi:hypothetical protein B0H16DRAFT_1604706 [Mycena metata]|uniref:Uncharacterized protein n=1 Tax=Mycena metata TaxID=1033252 RepID=A0AAD7HGS7_9AGAR|nr:hypothetical protein B0H16DRAFT_1604706 [Mycena metata]